MIAKLRPDSPQVGSNMSCISDRYFENALRHSQILSEHGQKFEQMAEKLDGRLLNEIQVLLVNDAGQQIQQRAQLIEELAKRPLGETNSECFGNFFEIHQHQRQVVLWYLTAIEVLVQAIKDSLK